MDHIADLWRSADEDLRSAVRETVLSFGTNITDYFSPCFHFIMLQFYDIFHLFIYLAGKKGYLAFQRMDQLYTEMEEEAYQNQETEITFL